MFEFLGDKISNAMKNIRGLGRITEENIRLDFIFQAAAPAGSRARLPGSACPGTEAAETGGQVHV